MITNSTSRFALTQIFLDRTRMDEVTTTYMVKAPSDYGVQRLSSVFTSSACSGYRYGFNGMEKDDEAKGAGNSYTTEFRQYDPRLGRWLSMDPLMATQPAWSPYKAFYDNPLIFNDPDGGTEYQVTITENKKTGETVIEAKTAKGVMTDGVQHKHWSGQSSYHREVYWYDYAKIKVTTIHEDGTKSVEHHTEILYDNGVQNSDVVWFYPDPPGKIWVGGDKAPTREHGISQWSGIGMKGKGGEGAQDFSRNVFGSIDFDVLKTILKPGGLSGHSPKDWKKLTQPDFKAWLEYFNKNRKNGEAIGKEIDNMKKESQNTEKFECPTCGEAFPASDTTKHNKELGRESGPFTPVKKTGKK